MAPTHGHGSAIIGLMRGSSFIVDGKCQYTLCHGTQIEVTSMGPDNSYDGRCLECGRQVFGSLMTRPERLSGEETRN